MFRRRRTEGRDASARRQTGKVPVGARAYLQLADDGSVAMDASPSSRRRTAALALVLALLVAAPLLWATNASGSDGHLVAVKSGSSGPGSGEDDGDGDGNSGPGGGDNSGEGDSTATGTTAGTGPSNS